MLESIAAKLGYQKMRNGSWFHPDTQKNVLVSGGRAIITEEVSFESDAQLAHVLTCNAGALDEARLSRIDGEWTFATSPEMHERFALVLMHSPTMTIRVPINRVDVSYAQYHEGKFLDYLAEDLCKEEGMKVMYCEVTAHTTSIAGLNVVLIASLQGETKPFEGISAVELLKMEPSDPRDAAIIAVLRSVLDGYQQQSSDTSEHEGSHLVHSPDVNTLADAFAHCTP